MGICEGLSNCVELSNSDEVRQNCLKLQMVVAEIRKGADHRASGHSDKSIKIRSLVLSKSGVCSDECGLEIGKGARGRLELWESFPKVSEIGIDKKGRVE